MEFNHADAQVYEFKSHIDWIDRNNEYENILADIKQMGETGEAFPHYLDQFFKGDKKVFEAFVNRVKDKTVMEVAGGICGVLPLWKNWIKGNKISIDPLIVQCDEYLKAKGESWFGGIELFPINAELFVPQLENTIDGFILWRNGLDHMENPEEGIATVSKYAKQGCEFYFWSDVKHLGEVDQGHHSICDTPDEMEELIKKYGWEIRYRTPNIHSGINMIEYGAVCVKL